MCAGQRPGLAAFDDGSTCDDAVRACLRQRSCWSWTRTPPQPADAPGLHHRLELAITLAAAKQLSTWPSCRSAGRAKLEPVFPYRTGQSEPRWSIALPLPTSALAARCRRLATPAGASSPCSPAPTASTTPPAPSRRPAAEPHILVMKNLTAAGVAESHGARWSRPSGPGPDRHAARRLLRRRRAGRLRQVHHGLLPRPRGGRGRRRDLLKQRDGLMLGICNGFQALIKLGLVPYGEIRPIDGRLTRP